MEKEQEIAVAIKRIIELLGDNPERERVARAYSEWFRGYGEPDFKMKAFSSDYSGIIIRKQIPFQSFCEHHIAMYKGFIDFGYVPDGKVLGISKIIRFLQHNSARLTIQEDLTDMLINKFCEIVKPKGAIIIVTANHSCEGTRGVKVPDVPTITSSVRGLFASDATAKAEFLSIIKK